MDPTRLACTIILCTGSLMAADEFQANVRTAGNQCNVAITADLDGRFALAWSSYFSTQGRSNDIIVRRFDLNGHAAGGEFRANATREGNQTEPAIASNGKGFLFVVWQGPDLNEDEDVFARVFDPNDEPITGEFRVNTDPLGRQLHPSVAACDDGTFVVVWENYRADGTISICGQLFESTGSAVGGELAIDHDIWDCRYPDVVMDGSGNFAVVWMQDRSSNTIFARLFDRQGAARSGPLSVSTADIASVTHPSIAMSRSGDFVVAWDGDPTLASRDDIHARCFGPEGTPRSAPLLVNVQREGRQQWPCVAIGETQEFVVVWQHEREAPSLSTDILARRFDLDGRPESNEFELNVHVTGKQRDPVAAMSRHGSAIAAWQSEDQDGSGYGIFVRVEPGADLNADGAADLRDFCVLGQSWRGGQHDLTGDGLVDARDLRRLCRHWLK